MRKIRVDAIELDVDRDEQSREHVILRASSNREIADVVIPVLDVPEVAAGLLSLAQKAARKLVGVDLNEKIAETYKKKLVRFFPEPDNIFITSDSSTLVLEMGCGSLNFKLTPELLAALKNLEFPAPDGQSAKQSAKQPGKPSAALPEQRPTRGFVPPLAAVPSKAEKADKADKAGKAEKKAEAAPGRPKEARSASAEPPRRSGRSYRRR